ncbi:MAG: hydrogenase formation protein HypD [Actinomycetota bacterium]|nr:hydrogenase formation protein HypD [Actinomycetota bacterium]MDP3629461.1 hydrogenase formation protein HypD [Actinomycetota bacterium]
MTDDLLGGFRNPEHARALVTAIRETAVEPSTFMEVCGTHTMAIAKNGLRGVMPDTIKLLSGPGCPVCVTANIDIDAAIETARQPDVILTTFGDMMKVPGSYSSLSREKGDGRDVRIVYSPLDSLALAEAVPDKHVVFLGVGFETTAPTVALTIKEAQRRGLKNWSALALHKTVPEALRALTNDPDVQINGFILPGHVSTIIGSEPYRFLAEEYGVPGVITGFEPVDVLQGIWMLAKQRAEGRAEIEIAYTRAVMPEGNPVAMNANREVFEPVDSEWRGIGVIPGTGLAIRAEFAEYDASLRVPVSPPEPRAIKGCQCGDVLRGALLPFECKLFGRGCTPEHPIGPCMVSSEGSCAAYYRYTDYGKA